MSDQFDTLSLERIVTSTTNPRKHFNQDKLNELAESIKSSGVHQPVLVRPLPGSRVAETGRKITHELVCGERRYRASKLAGVPTIPAMIRELSDEQVLEIQIIENLQRDDLSELEEAEGYQQLMQHSGLNAEQVGAKIGKSRAYVYARIKLLDLSQECKQAMREGKIDASRAVLIARIPDPKLQAKALDAASTPNYSGDVMSVRGLQSWLQANVMLRLEKAIFKITDARLVPVAGSCKDCPKRTGDNPDLFADVNSADICTDPTCFHEKEEAHRNALRRKAEAKGMRIVEGTEAKELVPHQYTDRIDGYCHLSQVRNDITMADGSTGHTMRELLGTDAPAPILFEHPYTKVLIEAVPEDEAEAVLLAKGLLKATSAASISKKIKPEDELKQLQDAAARDTRTAVHMAQFDATVDAIRATTGRACSQLLADDTFLRAWLHTSLDCTTGNDFMAKALGYTFQKNEDKVDGLNRYIDTCSRDDIYRAVAIVMMIEDQASRYFSSDNVPLVMQAAMASLKIDDKALAKQATATVKADYADRLKDVKAKLDTPKAPPATAPLAQPRSTGGQSQKAGSGSNAKAAPLRKPKLSAEEAISGIAAAMQGIDRAPAAPKGAVASPEATIVKTHAAQGGLDVGFVVSQRVQVTTDDERLGTIARKWAGKQGTVSKTNVDHDPDFYDVTFKGRNGGIATFRTDQLQAQGATA